MTKLKTRLLKDLPVKTTPITDSDYVINTNNGTTKLKVKDITKNLETNVNKLNNDVKEILEKGTTVETIKNATEKEIQKQIASGNMTNLTIAPGSITKDKLDPNIKFGIEDGEVTIKKLHDSMFVTEKCDEYTFTGQGKALSTFPIKDIKKGEVIVVSAEITVLNSSNGLQFEYRIGHSNTDNSYSNLQFPGLCAKINNDESLIHTRNYTITTENNYLSILLHTSAGVNENIKFRVKWNVTHLGKILDKTKTTLMWNAQTDTYKEIVLSSQSKGSLATYNSLIEKSNEILADCDNKISNLKINNIDNLSDSLFELDKMAIFDVPNQSYAFMSLDLSTIENRLNKTVAVEYVIEKMDSNFNGIESRMSTGNYLDDYSGAVNFTAKVVDIGNNEIKVTNTYTIGNANHSRLTIYPRINSNKTTRIKIKNVNCIVDGVKLEWIESKVYGASKKTEIQSIAQNGKHLVKLEYFNDKIKNLNIEDSQIIKNIQSEIEQLRGMMGSVETSVTSILNTKKWGVVGDSITFGTGTTDVNTKPYCNLIGVKYLMTINKSAMPGKTLAKRPTYNDSLLSNLQAINKNCDYITVFGGTNDYGNNISLGNKDDDTLDTFYGALNLFCKEYYNNFSASKFAFLTPIRRSGGETANKAGHKLSDYVNAIKETCNKYGIPCLDMYNIGLDPKYSAIYSKYIPDGLHPNDAGHERISNYIAKFLEQL